MWQVLSVYALMSWGSIELVTFATRVAGLPLWTPAMAGGLLLIGLPITLATAVVQEGIPWLRIEDLVDPNELEGLTPDQVHVVPEAHPMYGVGLLTWRNAILGGVMAAALLATSVVSYLAMWALGIGPVGSLLAQGVINTDDPVLVAEFDNRTDNVLLGTVVTRAVTLDLSRSTVIRPLAADAVGAALDRWGLARGALNRELALDLASREGVKAVVAGDLSSVSRGYRVTAGIVLADGTAVARFEQTIGGEDELQAAIDVLTARLRERFGESLRSIRAERAAVLE